MLAPRSIAILAVAWPCSPALLLPPLRRARRRRARFAAGRCLEPGARRRRRATCRLARDCPRTCAGRLDGLVIAFLAEKQFVGCNGLEVTDEIRATIAAQACLLLLGRPGSLYDELHSILVYPDAFWVEDEVHDDDGLVTQRRRVLSGEAWDSHRIVLSWEDVARRARPATMATTSCCTSSRITSKPKAAVFHLSRRSGRGRAQLG